MDEATVTEFAYKAYNYVSNGGNSILAAGDDGMMHATGAVASSSGSSYMDMFQSALTYLYSLMSNLGGSSWGIAAIALIGVMMLASIVATLKVIKMIFTSHKKPIVAHGGATAAPIAKQQNKIVAAGTVVPAISSTRMRRIYAAVRIYMYAWFMDVKCRTMDLIKLLLKPLKTAIFVLRHIGSLQKMENVIQMDSFHVAGSAAMNGQFTKEHAQCICLHARTVMRTQTLTPEQLKVLSAIENSIIRASK